MTITSMRRYNSKILTEITSNVSKNLSKELQIINKQINDKKNADSFEIFWLCHWFKKNHLQYLGEITMRYGVIWNELNQIWVLVCSHSLLSTSCLWIFHKQLLQTPVALNFPPCRTVLPTVRKRTNCSLELILLECSIIATRKETSTWYRL